MNTLTCCTVSEHNRRNRLIFKNLIDEMSIWRALLVNPYITYGIFKWSVSGRNAIETFSYVHP